jgi:hypothetical protein
VEYKAPIYQLQAGRHPTQKDIARGLKRMTFNFDFVRRNVRRGENFKNQEIKPDKPQEKKAPKPKPEPEGNLQIDMDE